MNILSYSLSLLLFIITLHNSYFFLVTKKIGLTKWFFFNACAPWNFFYLFGLIINVVTKGNKFLLAMSLPGLIFFAIKGILVFSWSRPTSQINHLIMLLNSAWAIWFIFKNQPNKHSFKGIIMGIIILTIFNYFHTNFISQNQVEFDKIMPTK